MLGQKLFRLDVGHVGFADIDGIRNINKDVLSEGRGQPDGVQLGLGLAVGHEDRDEGLRNVPCGARRSPWLSEGEEHLGTGRGSVGEGVTFEVRSEVEPVIKDLCAVFFPQRIAQGSRIGACVNDGATQWRRKDIVIDHFDDQPTGHGIEDFLCVRVGVALGKLNLLDAGRSEEHLRSFESWLLGKTGIKENATPVHDLDTLAENWDRPVINLHQHPAIGR